MMREQLLSECGGCGSLDPLLLFNAGPRSSGIYRRLCPTCILKSHRGSFCPVCFDPIDESPSLPPSATRTGVISCGCCHSLSHAACLPSDFASPPLYHCPPCSNPNFVYFPSYRSKPNLPDHDQGRVIDTDCAKALLAAVRISGSSMTKAANVARVEAEKRVKEATFAKKRAREALERVAHLKDRNPATPVSTMDHLSPLVSKHFKKQSNNDDPSVISVRRRSSISEKPNNVVVAVSPSLLADVRVPPKNCVSTEVKNVENNIMKDGLDMNV